MVRGKALFLPALALASLLSLPLRAEPPALIQYQGIVLSPDGSPRSGPIDVELRIFDAPTEGSLLFTETHPGVALLDGVFSLPLGGQQLLDPSVFASPGPRWLEVVAGGELLSPRQQILSVPYCLDSATVGGQTPLQLATAPSPVSGFQQVSASASATSVSASCPPGKVAVGGGCDCGAATLDSARGRTELLALRLLDGRHQPRLGALCRRHGGMRQRCPGGRRAVRQRRRGPVPRWPLRRRMRLHVRQRRRRCGRGMRGRHGSPVPGGRERLCPRLSVRVWQRDGRPRRAV